MISRVTVTVCHFLQLGSSPFGCAFLIVFGLEFDMLLLDLRVMQPQDVRVSGSSIVRMFEMRCATSYRPFELFVNENYELWNEAKMNVMFERGSAQDPWRSPLSAKMHDAST